MNHMMEDDNMISVHFESILDLMECEPKGANASSFSKALYHGGHGRSAYGFTNSNSADVVNHALLGDPEMFDDMMKKSHQIQGDGKVQDYEQKAKVSKRRKIKSDFGDEVDIHKIYQGQLDKAWTRTIREESDAAVHLVTLFVLINGLWSDDVSKSLWIGATVIRLTKELELAGKSVKVMVGTKSHNVYRRTNKIITTSIIVKNYGENLPEERLAAMCHLGFFRVFGFAAFYANEKYEANSGLGGPSRMEQKDAPVHFKSEIEKGHTRFVIVDYCSSKQSAEMSLRKAYSQMESFS